MKTIEIPRANKELDRMLKAAKNEGLVLTKQGHPIAALVSIDDMDEELLSLGTSPKFLRMLRKSFRELDRGDKVGLAEMRKRVLS